MKKRNNEIDILRGISMFVMVLIHTNAYFLSNKFVFFLWDYSQFAVATFIFCSSYLLFHKGLSYTQKNLGVYFKKRLLRLLIPYYLFLPFLFVLIYGAQPHKFTFEYVINNMLMIGGIDFNWLVVLFLWLLFINPLILYLFEKRRPLFYLFSFLSLSASILLLFIKLPYPYRFTMWLPWSLVSIFTLYFVKNEHKPWFYFVTILCMGVLFGGLFLLQTSLGHSLVQYQNKYPPNVYHLSYSIMATTILYVLARKRVFNIPLIHHLLLFLSKNSYSLYFIHIFILFGITLYLKHTQFTWVTFFLVIFTLTVITQWILNMLQKIVLPQKQ